MTFESDECNTLDCVIDADEVHRIGLSHLNQMSATHWTMSDEYNTLDCVTDDEYNALDYDIRIR